MGWKREEKGKEKGRRREGKGKEWGRRGKEKEKKRKRERTRTKHAKELGKELRRNLKETGNKCDDWQVYKFQNNGQFCIAAYQRHTYFFLFRFQVS